MAFHGLDHLAIQVPDPRAAEAYYVELFDARVACREARVDGFWRTLPYDAGWDDAAAAGRGGGRPGGVGVGRPSPPSPLSRPRARGSAARPAAASVLERWSG